MTEAAYEILQSVARSLGYDYLTLRSEVSARHCRCICAFGRQAIGRQWHYRPMLLHEDGHVVSIDMFTSDGQSKTQIEIYEEFARKLYQLLENKEAVHAEDKKLDASMVPEFMIGCVLNGIC